MPRERLPLSPVIPLKVYSHYSILGKDRTVAASSPEALVHQAARVGQTRIALTDHNFFGLGELLRTSKEVGLTPLPGIDLPVDLGNLSRDRVSILARNTNGLRTLFHWVSRIYRDRGEVSPDDINRQSGDLIAFIQKKFPQHEEYLKESDNVFYAVSDPNMSQEKRRELVALEKFTGKTVVTAEVRLASPLGEKTLRFLLRVFEKSGENVNPRGLLNYSLKSSQELWALYRRFPEALQHNKEIVESISVGIPEISVLKAKSATEKGLESYHYLEREADEGLKKFDDPVLTARVHDELELIKAFRYEDYMLIVLETARFCKEKDIVYQVPGSGSNSAVLWVTGVTQVDPRRLSFDSFLHPDRADLPDVDFELPYDRKGEVIEYLLNRYDSATLLSVVKRMRERSIKNLATQHRVHLLPEEIEALSVENIPLSVSTHPAGIIFWNGSPQQRIADTVVAQIDKDAAEKDLVIPKIDLLQRNGVARLERIRDLLRKDGLEAKIYLHDSDALDRIFHSGKTIGISEIESPHLRRILTTIGRLMKESRKRPTVDHIAQVLALARLHYPARERYYGYVENGTNSLAKSSEAHPELIDIVGRTNYVVIYQGQIRKLAALAGMNYEDAEGLIKKRNSESLEMFPRGLADRGFNAEIIGELLEQMQDFTPFGFREGHSLAKALTAYKLAFLAEKQPAYFWTAVLQIVSERPHSHYYSRQAYVNEALRDGMKFDFPPVGILPLNPVIADAGQKRIQAGGSLFFRSENFSQEYSNFRHEIQQGVMTPPEFIRYQLNHFGVSLTHNPIEMYPQKYVFNPKKLRQEVVAQPLLRRHFGSKQFITLDSGRLVNAILSDEIAFKNHAWTRNPFWRIVIEKYGEDAWEIKNILPLNAELTP